MEQVLVDTSFLYAVLEPHEKQHAVARAIYLDSPQNLLFPSVGTTELTYLANRLGGTPAVVEALIVLHQSSIVIIEPTREDYERIIAILRKYHDSRIDFVDACIMALAERLKVTRILTFDRRDFGLYRPAHVESFELLP